jgi:hypothetical protein
MDKFRIALIAALLLLVFMRNAAAVTFTAADVSAICAETTGTTSIFGTGITSQQGLLAIALILMLTMLLVSAVLYMLGYAFGINLLLKFSKDEMREVAVTSLVVLVFLGSFSAVSSSTGLGGFINNVAGVSAINVFTKDCDILTSSALNMTSNWVGFAWMQSAFNFIGGINIVVAPGGWGVYTYPMSGLTLLTDSSGMMGLFTTFTGALMILMFVIAVMLGIFYVLFPLFFYAGIVLRTLPWTRAAGGAFLGLFIAFYFVFPFLLYFFLSPYSQAAAQQNVQPLNSLGNIANDFSTVNPFEIFGSAASAVSNSSALVLFITGVAEPSIFMLITIVLSLIISMDFMEALGDMLGSPALSQRNALRGLI